MVLLMVHIYTTLIECGIKLWLAAEMFRMEITPQFR